METGNGIKNLSYAQEGPYIGEEERIRHDALFYSQNPEDGLLLSGERARSLFIKSKLPLQDLSKIWKLADVTRDNMLDESEFAVAIHLIQRRLCGFDIPISIPNSWRPEARPLLVIKQINEEEFQSYGTIFDWLLPHNNDIQNSEVVLKFLGTSGISTDVLAKIWDLSDIDRDGMINKEEFFIALHLTRFCADNNSELKGSIDVVSMLPKATSGESVQEKRRRRTEYQTEMRKLRSLKVKLESELINAKVNRNSAAKSKIQFELDRTRIELETIIKKEATVGKEITEMNLQTSVTTNIEVLRPFDRSFLMKQQSCGIDFLKAIQYKQGHCVFCEGVTPEVFIKDNILDFARNLPLNPNLVTKRRGSRSPSKDITKDNNSFPRNYHLNEALQKENPHTEEFEKVSCNSDSYSSDDESDSVDIGFKRRKRKKARSSREKPETVSQRRIRSLSKAISDIEARNKAAKEEMDKRVIRMKSESGSTTGETSSDTTNEKDKIAKSKEAYKRRSKSAIETFQQLLSSGSESSSDRGSGTKRRSLKNLQKTPWNESKEATLSSSSQSDCKQLKINGKINSGQKGSRDSRHTPNANGSLERDDRDLVISIVKNEKDEFDFQAQLCHLDNAQSSVNPDNMKNKIKPKASKESPSETNVLRDSLERSPKIHNDDLIMVESQTLKPIVANGVSKHDDEAGDGARIDAEVMKNENKACVTTSLKEIDEETVAPCHLPVDKRVQNLIDLLQETSCDSIEEENYRRKLSKSEETSCDKNLKTSNKECGDDLNLQAKIVNNGSRTSSFDASITSNKDEYNPRNSPAHLGSSGEISNQLPHSNTDTVASMLQSEKVNSDTKVKKRKVLRTKSGHMVRSKSVHGVYGLRNLLDPEKLSFVEECEWLETLMQAELETIERRKLKEATQSPKAEREKRPQLYTRDETIDETSLNLGDSRKLVKSLLDMETELRKEKEMYFKRKDKIKRNKEFLERRKSMPVGQEALHEAKARTFNDKDAPAESNISQKPETIKDENEVLSESQMDVTKHPKKSLEANLDTGNSEDDSIDIKDMENVKVQSNTSSDYDRGKDTSDEFSHIPPVANDATNNKEVIQDEKKNSPNKDYKMEKADNIAFKEPYHRPELEEDMPLKDIKVVKRMFEEKSTPVRPIDKYKKSLSMEVRPLGLGRSRSKSFGEGLNRASEDSTHIQVFEKQSSFEKSTKRRESVGKKERGIIFYEEAIADARRKKSQEDNRAKQEVLKVDERVHNDAEEITKASNREEEAIPIFKKVGDFKQLFEGEKPSNEVIPKKKITIVKQNELIEKKKTSLDDEKNEVRGLINEGEYTFTNEMKSKERKRDDEIKLIDHKEKPMNEINNGKNGSIESACDSGEDGIPSIKDRLLLFQNANVEKNGVKRRDKEIKKVRPKSFHGNGSHLHYNDSEESVSAMGAELGFVHYRDHMKSPQEKCVRDLGECIMENDGNSSNQTVKADIPTQIIGKGTETEATSEIHSSPKYTHINAEKSVAKSKKDSSINEFSYMKMVKDDRIRRELEEQEAREAEIRERLNGSLDSERTAPISAVTGYNKTVKGQQKAEGSSSVKHEQHVSEPPNTPFQYIKQSECLTMENDKQRDEQLKSQRIVKDLNFDKRPEASREENSRNSQSLKSVNKLKNSLDAGNIRKEKALPKDKDQIVKTLSQDRGSLKTRKIPSRIEMELEEERRREEELEQERKQRDEEKNRILEEQKKQLEAIEAEKKKVREEELAKQNAIREEKMKRQEKTRGLRALFETS